MGWAGSRFREEYTSLGRPRGGGGGGEGGGAALPQAAPQHVVDAQEAHGWGATAERILPLKRGKKAEVRPSPERPVRTQPRPKLKLLDTSATLSQLYLSYLGGSGDDCIQAAAAAAGDEGVWVGGWTDSVRAVDGLGIKGERQDGFVSFLTVDGLRKFTTYVGGDGVDQINAMVMAPDQTLWVAGSTSSRNLPLSEGSTQKAVAGKRDALVANIGRDGAVKFLTCVGGTDTDVAHGVSVAADGSVWVTGETQSTNFPVTKNAKRPKRGGGGSDAFVVKLFPTGEVAYSSYLSGDAGTDGGLALAQAYDHTVWLGGLMTPQGYIENGAYFAHLDSDGGVLASRTFGGTGSETVKGLVVLDNGNVLLAGDSSSNESLVELRDDVGADEDRPIQRKPHLDVFLAEVSAEGELGGVALLEASAKDYLTSVALNGAAQVWVGGATMSLDLPLVGKGLSDTLKGRTDGLIAKFDLNAWRDGAKLTPLASTYFGGAGEEVVTAVVPASDGSVWVFGTTTSADLNPTYDALQKAYSGGKDAFVMRLT